MNKCNICGKKGRRLCPGINGIICSVCCGSKRNSEITCTSNCPHSPFSTTGYDLWLKIDGVLPTKYIKYIISNCGKNKFDKAIGDMSFEDTPPENSFTVAAGAAAYNILFIKRDKQGKILVDKWEAEGWDMLNNDEQVMMRYLRNSRVTIIEIQKILNYQAMECVDMLEPEGKPFILFDRSTVSRAGRFTRLFSWLTHFPNFSRTIHGGIEVTDFIYNEFMDTIKRDAKKESKKFKDFKLKNYLSENFGKYCRLCRDLALEKRKTAFNNMDAHHCIAIYDIKAKAKASDIEAILEKYPEFNWEDKEPEENDAPDTLYYSWVRRGESKVIEKQMNPAFHHDDDESMGVGTLANVRLYPDKLFIETFTKQKYEFVKEMVTKYFGSLLSLKQERIVDIAKQIAERSLDEIPKNPKEKQVFMSLEDEQKAMQLFYEHRYKKFLDENVPMINNKTPREASKNPKLRPELIELMKIHIKGIEQLNKEKGIDLNIDWVIDELGLSELK